MATETAAQTNKPKGAVANTLLAEHHKNQNKNLGKKIKPQGGTCLETEGLGIRRDLFIL